VPAEPGAAEPGAAEPAGDPVRFSAAIRQWLERQRAAAAPSAPEPPPAPTPRSARPHETALPRVAPAVAVPGAPPSEELGRIAAAIAQQAVQIERILEMCEGHQLALERLEAQIEARFAALTATAAPQPGPELSELRGAVEEQRQRVTALAKTIHNLAQWLAAQRARPAR
jgi:hypothetical protein